ncbi:MAG: hypothetical protein WCA46_01550 [Actinocatenispora sp.]
MTAVADLGGALWFAVFCFALGCGVVGFAAGHVVRAERDWQDHVDRQPVYVPRHRVHARHR